MREIRKIMYCTDFSKNALNALDYALSLARRYDAKLYVAHVVRELRGLIGIYITHLPLVELQKSMIKEAGEELKRFAADRLADFKNCETVLLHGNPAVELTRFAEEKGVDLMVLSTHGENKPEHVIFGSTADNVIKRAKCPILAVPHTTE